jgi:hypothetical protein
MRWLVLDTNACGKIAASQNRRQVVDCLRTRYQIAASANTILELLLGVCRSTSEGYFGEHKDRFRVAVGSSSLKKAKFMDFPLAVALRHGPRVRRVEDSAGRQRLRDYVRAVLKARSLRELKVSGVRWAGGQLLTLKCELVEQDLSIGKSWYSVPLLAAKANNLTPGNREIWTRHLARFWSVVLSDEEVEALALVLDAAYEYQKTVWTMSGGSFNPERNENDWIDWNQLFYLADPSVLFVTEEGKIRERCQGSSQSSRIVLVDELLAQEGLAL